MSTLHEEYLKDCKIYCEYGVGESTVLACNASSVEKVYAVDSIKHWIEWVQNELVIADTRGKAMLYYVDIGAESPDGAPSENWGHPLDTSKIDDWWKYSSFMQVHNIKETPDLVYVDGRFRVACALKSWELLADDGFLIVDDYNESYEVIEKYYNWEISTVEITEIRTRKQKRVRMADRGKVQIAFSKKKDINMEELREDIRKYEFRTKVCSLQPHGDENIH